MATWFDPRPKITNTSRYAWETVDISGLVPVGTVGIAVLMVGSATNYYGGIRKYGSTDDLIASKYAKGQSVVWVGLSEDYKVDVFNGHISSEVITFYIIAAFGSTEAYFPTNRGTQVSWSNGSWKTLDFSGDCPVGSSAVLLWITQETSYKIVGFRKGGSSDDAVGPGYFGVNGIVGGIMALDSSRHIEAFKNSGNIYAYFAGYLNDTIVKSWNDTREDVSLGVTGSYQDITPSNIPGGAKAVIISTIYQGNTRTVGLRKDGGGDDLAASHCGDTIQPVAMASPIEGYISNSDVDFYVLGFLGDIDTEVNVDADPIEITLGLLAIGPENNIEFQLEILGEVSAFPVEAEPIEISLFIDEDTYVFPVTIGILADLEIDNLGDVDIPALQVYGVAEMTYNIAHIKVPKLMVAGTGLPGVVGTGHIIFPRLDVEGEIYYVTGIGHVEIPRFSILGEALPVGIIGIGNVRIPLPFNSIHGIGHMAGLVSGAVEIPVLQVHGYGTLTPVDEVFKSIVMNAFNYSVTEYFHYRFNSFAKFNGKVIATGPGGVYCLDEGKNNGDPIYAEFRSGLEDFREQVVKYIREAWLTLRSDGQLEIVVQVGENQLWAHDIEILKKILHEVRSKIARGLRDRYFALGVRNINGSDFEVNSIRVKVEMARGRTR